LHFGQKVSEWHFGAKPDSAQRVRALVEGAAIDFIVVDEIDYAKRRGENVSKRRELVQALICHAGERNPALYVLGMSATPVINNLHEGRSMVELVTGVVHEELDDRPTVPNCMALHQRLVSLGIRWMPEYTFQCDEKHVEVDCGTFLDDIRALGRGGEIKGDASIFSRSKEGRFLNGRGQSRPGRFYCGDVDVLIGTRAIGTGVDGLQQVCNRLIVNVLPWTRAEFDQLRGRIYRQGQKQDTGQGDGRSAADLRDGPWATLVLVRVENAPPGVQEVHRRRRR
jgi:hypothetical protein